MYTWNFPGGPVVRTLLCIEVQGAQIQSLVGELRSCELHGMAKKIIYTPRSVFVSADSRNLPF